MFHVPIGSVRFISSVGTSAALAASFLVNRVVCTSVGFGAGMVANRNYVLRVTATGASASLRYAWRTGIDADDVGFDC